MTAEFMDLFAEEAAGHLAQLRRLCREPDTQWQAAFVAAHTLKGSAAMLDVRGVQLVAAELERLLGGEPPNGSPAWLADAGIACEVLGAELGDLRPGAAPSAAASDLCGRLRGYDSGGGP
ncbi:Hpt domain-containing protein [Deinococcus sp. JMULE3]|uniref:Hpt domain-containing protein n=1 Tax=Deinococcus sp. JMULE3 TaxID=2518341 RepID=UPI001575E915|nr:Hpt domain-containing protein [Deinococcus sp. JMULE3]